MLAYYRAARCIEQIEARNLEILGVAGGMMTKTRDGGPQKPGSTFNAAPLIGEIVFLTF